MSCKFSEYGTGLCQLFGDGIERPIDENGICLCQDDSEPEASCEEYEE